MRQSAGAQHRAGLVEHPGRVAVAGQMRSHHVLARYQRPDMQIMDVGHAVDGAQRRTQLLDVDVARRCFGQNPQRAAR